VFSEVKVGGIDSFIYSLVREKGVIFFSRWVLEYEKGQTFIFGFYHIRKKGENAMIEKIEKALEEIRPSLQADGGDVEFVSVENGIVKVRLTGACGGCPMSQMTLKQGIEKFVKKAVPEVLSVEAVQP
jgi:Fe-S cluster biogenesis protein NfuA